MYIINDIAYAGESPQMIRVCGVRPLENYRLWLLFTTGEEKIYDCKPLFRFPAYQPLQDQAVFCSVYIDYGVVVWNHGEIDIAPERLYEDSTPAGKHASA